MRLHKTRQHITAWIACFAILMAALAPSLSHALSAMRSGDAGWAEICSTNGVKNVKVAGVELPGSDAPAQSGIHLEHCPYCLVHADVPTLPATVALVLPLNPDSPAYPSLFYQSPRPLFLWSSAQSRAPPAAA
jgi:hypothetical protein